MPTEREFSSRLNAALEKLAATGMRRNNYAAPIYRPLWRLGVPVWPPHFASFAVNAFMIGSVFGVLWGGIMWLLATWLRARLGLPFAPVGEFLLIAAAAGSLFGLMMAAYVEHGKQKHKLPPWSQLSNAP